MIEQLSTGVLAVATLAAVIGLLSGNKTAMVLLASTIYSSMLCWADVEFNVALWLSIDLIAILWIVVLWADGLGRGIYGKKRDIVILSIFFAIWPFYFTEFEWRSSVINFLIALQMLATFPWRRAGERVRGLISKIRGDDTGGLECAWI